MSCAPSLVLGPFTVGEIPAPLVYTFLDADGAPMDITGFTARFVYREASSTPVDSLATVVDGPGGKVQHIWNGTEFPTPGAYSAQFWIGNFTNRWASTQILWSAANGVGLVPAI